MHKKYKKRKALFNFTANPNKILHKKETYNHENQKFQEKVDIKQEDHC